MSAFHSSPWLITVIPLIGDEPCIAMQSMSGWPLKKAVHNAMIANVGAAARPSHRVMPGAALPPPAQVSTSRGQDRRDHHLSHGPTGLVGATTHPSPCGPSGPAR